MNLISFITPILLSFFPILFLVSSNLGERITFGQISGTIIISGIFSDNSQRQNSVNFGNSRNVKNKS